MFFTTKVASISTLVALAGVTQGNPLSEYGVKLDARTPPQQNGIQFVCTDFPDVCTNMCWGMSQEMQDEPPKTLKIVALTSYLKKGPTVCLKAQPPSSTIRPAAPRRESVGKLLLASTTIAPGTTAARLAGLVPSPTTTATSTHLPAQRPITAMARKTDAVVACPRARTAVSTLSNASALLKPCMHSALMDEVTDRWSCSIEQGAVLSKGYRDFCNNNAPCNFQVFFGNPGASGHCSPGSQGNCNSDSAEKCSGSINIIQRSVEYDISPFGGFTKRDEPHVNGTYIPGPARFLTYRGTELDAPYGGFIGQPVHAPRAVNETLHNELIARHEYDHEGDDDQFDELTENMVSDIDYIREVVWEARLKQ